MKKLYFPIAATSLVLLFYLISVYTDTVFAVVFLLFTILNIMTIWMVIRILRDGEAPDQTFDEYWYEDRPK
jgi:hypothetical protein